MKIKPYIPPTTSITLYQNITCTQTQVPSTPLHKAPDKSVPWTLQLIVVGTVSSPWKDNPYKVPAQLPRQYILCSESDRCVGTSCEHVARAVHTPWGRTIVVIYSDKAIFSRTIFHSRWDRVLVFCRKITHWINVEQFAVDYRKLTTYTWTWSQFHKDIMVRFTSEWHL